MPTIQKFHTGFIDAMVQSGYKFDAQHTKTIDEKPMNDYQLRDFYCSWCGCNEKPIEEPFFYPYCPQCKGN
jgi:hypothetical protein